jgi:hypothetical protein
MTPQLPFKKGALTATEVSASYPTMASKSMGSNAKVDGGADQGTGIKAMPSKGGMKNAACNFSADVKVIG